MLLWFLARDEMRSNGWQSGLVSASGRRKPSFYEFQELAGAARKHQLTVLRSVRRARVPDVRELLRGTVEGGFDPSWLPVGPTP
jgi:hypothetical protein